MCVCFQINIMFVCVCVFGWEGQSQSSQNCSKTQLASWPMSKSVCSALVTVFITSFFMRCIILSPLSAFLSSSLTPRVLLATALCFQTTQEVVRHDGPSLFQRKQSSVFESPLRFAAAAYYTKILFSLSAKVSCS